MRFDEVILHQLQLVRQKYLTLIQKREIENNELVMNDADQIVTFFVSFV